MTMDHLEPVAGTGRDRSVSASAGAGVLHCPLSIEADVSRRGPCFFTGITAASNDRIVSGTISMLAVSGTGYERLTQAILGGLIRSVAW